MTLSIDQGSHEGLGGIGGLSGHDGRCGEDDMVVKVDMPQYLLAATAPLELMMV